MRTSTSAEVRRQSEDSPDTSLLATSPKNSVIHTPQSSSDDDGRVGLSIVTKKEELQGSVLQDGKRESVSSSRSLSSDLELGDMRGTYQMDHDEDGRFTGRIKRESLHGSRRSIDMDGRPSIESMDVWQEAQRMGKQAFLRKVLINALLIALWYLFSICISIYNKWMFSPGNLDFHFPMFTTSLHMLVQFTLASIMLLLFPRFRPRHGVIDSAHGPVTSSGRSLKETVDPSKPIMTPWFYLTRIATTGTVTGLDIGLGNTSLKYITLTFFTMCKSSTLGFVLIFAIFFRLEKPSWKIGGIIGVMTVGVVMMVAGETAFNALGFSLLMIASFCSGIRWSLTQMLLRRTPATSNPFSSLFFLTPVMFVILFLVAIPAEGFSELKTGLDDLIASKGAVLGLGILLFPGCLAFFMTSAEFALLKRSSVVTLSVCGIFKEVLTITAAGLIFGDVLTPINISGLLVTLAAIAFYNFVRMRKMKRQEMAKAVEAAEAAEEDSGNGSGSGNSGLSGVGAAGAAMSHGNPTGDEAAQGLLAGDIQAPGMGGMGGMSIGKGGGGRRSLSIRSEFEAAAAAAGAARKTEPMPPRAAFMKRPQDMD